MFGLLGVGLGLLSGRKKDKQAQQASDQSIGIQRDQLAFDQKRYEEAQKQYKPIEDSLLAMAMKSQNPDIEGVTTKVIGDVNSQFAGAEAARLRQMQRMGVNPNSGRADSLGRQLSLTRALALAGGINSSRQKEIERADNTNWERLYNTNTLGANKMNGVTNSLASSKDALSRTYGNQSNLYRDQASGMYQASGQLAGGMLSAFMGGAK